MSYVATSDCHTSPLAVFSIPMVLSALGVALHFHGDNLLPYAAALALLALCLTVTAVSRAAPEALPLGSAGVLLGALLGWALLSLAWTSIPYATIVNIGMFSGSLALYAITRLALVQPPHQHLLALSMTGLGLLVAGMVMFEAARGWTPTAFFINPNTAAAFVNLFWPIPAVLAARSDTRSIRFIALGLVAFMVFAVTLSGSRGAAIALLMVLALVVLGVWRCGCPYARLIGLIAVVVLSVLVANISGAMSTMGTRGDAWGRVLQTASDPIQSGMSRWMIWQAAWDMIQARPLLGHGPGTFFQIYPAYRLPADGSGGFHVHNDYLQFWLELGLPGLMLILAIVAVCARRAWHALLPQCGTAGTVSPSAAFVVAVSAFGGLVVHSLVTYNLQVLVFILACGMGLAFMDHDQSPGGRIRVRLPSIRSRPIPAFALCGLLGLALVQLASMAMAQRALESGRAHSAAQNFSLAMEDFNRAQRLWPLAEPAWTAQARAYQRVLATLPEDRRGMRASAKTAGLAATDAAQKRNPHRPGVYAVMAELYLAPPDSDPEAAEQAFREALAHNPRDVEARIRLARLKRQRSGPRAALRVIEDGLRAYGNRPPRVLLKIRSALTAGGI